LYKLLLRVKVKKDGQKVLILVVCSRNYLSYISSKTQKKIWQNNKNFKIIHYTGDANLDDKELDYIGGGSKEYLYVNASNDYKNIAFKTLLALEEIFNEFEFDYIFRTNTSSFINLKKLEAYINENQNNLDYSGVVLDTKQQIKIASGAGYFISRKNIELIINNKDKFDINLPDDVAVAKLLKENNILPINTIREDLNEATTPKDLMKALKPQNLLNSNHFHYRCRLDPHFHRILEPTLFKYLNLVFNLNSTILKEILYIVILILFHLSNLKYIKKIIQKYYSFKFYGDIEFKNFMIYSKNK